MRVKLKPAAAAAAATFLLLLLLDLTWPGHGAWLLIVGILIGLIALSLWGRDRLQSQTTGPARNSRDLAQVGAYGLAGVALRPPAQIASAAGVPLAVVLAPVSALAILLYIGGAIGAAEPQSVELSATLTQDVAAIDRSTDTETTTISPATTTATTNQSNSTAAQTSASVSPPQNSVANPSSTATDTTAPQQTATPVKPIVVAAPSVATPSTEEPDSPNLAPESANTFEYQVVEGDTLYDIAQRYDSTVDIIMNLNDLDAYSYIHPGDVLIIPLPDEEDDEA